MPRFSAHISWLYADRPFLERIEAAAASGFKAVECRFPDGVPAEQFKSALVRNKVSVLGINTPQGGEGEFGLCAMPGRRKDWEKVFAQTLDFVTAVGGSAIHCLAGKVNAAQRAEAEKVFVDNLKQAADLAAAGNITVLIEPINQRDQPGYFLSRLEHAADIVAKAGKPNIKVQFDIYHMQIVGGDLIRRLEQYLPVIGHLQCASVPARHEPDEGEINYPAVFEAVDRLGYTGWIGAEYRPRGTTEAGLGWGRAYGLKPSN